MKDFEIGRLKLGFNHPPFIVAEMSGNHNQSLSRALEIVDAAAESGVNALKLQTYTADTMTLNLSQGAFTIRDPKSLWHGKKLYDLYEEAHTPWEWHKPIAQRCEEKGILFFSTPFDSTSVKFLMELGVPCFKIASFENTDLPLIKEVARTKLPIIISTGMATVEDLDKAVQAAKSVGNDNIILLKCTSTYPASPLDTNLKTIPHMRELFETHVGLSDHTMGIGAAIASVAFGAVFIEKHFTLDRAEGGVDAEFSLEPHEMKALVIETRRAWEALGKVKYGNVGAEQKSLQFRRSVYVVQDIEVGEIFTEQNVRCIRPGDGLKPEFYEGLLGKKAITKLKVGTPMNLSFVQRF